MITVFFWALIKRVEVIIVLTDGSGQVCRNEVSNNSEERRYQSQIFSPNLFLLHADRTQLADTLTD
jgi:hypothetical protein